MEENRDPKLCFLSLSLLEYLGEHFEHFGEHLVEHLVEHLGKHLGKHLGQHLVEQHLGKHLGGHVGGNFIILHRVILHRASRGGSSMMDSKSFFL